MQRKIIFFIVLFSFIFNTACASTIIGTAVDAAIEVAKIPVKAGKAVVDAVTDDDE